VAEPSWLPPSPAPSVAVIGLACRFPDADDPPTLLDTILTGRRAFRRSVSDAALGRIRPQLTYKMAWRGLAPTVASRWFASSKIHHGCGCRLMEPRKLGRLLVCARTGGLVDRDINAALNLRDWPDHASRSTVGAAAPLASVSSDGQDTGSPGAVEGHVRPQGHRPRPCPMRPEPAREPREGVQHECAY